MSELAAAPPDVPPLAAAAKEGPVTPIGQRGPVVGSARAQTPQSARSTAGLKSTTDSHASSFARHDTLPSSFKTIF